MDDGLLDMGIFAKAEVQAEVVLGGKPCTGGHLLKLFLAIPEKRNFSANSIAVTLRTFELELDPLLSRVDMVLVDKQRAALICNDYVERSIVPKISNSDGTSVVCVRHANVAGDVLELSRSVVNPDALLLVAGEAAPVEGRPVPGISDDGAVAGGHFGKIVPVAPTAIERDVAVGEEEINVAIVIQIAELSSEAPAAQFDTERVCHVGIVERITGSSILGYPEIVALNQDSGLGDIGDVDGVFILVEDVAKGDVHAALGRETDAYFFAHLAEALAIVDI